MKPIILIASALLASTVSAGELRPVQKSAQKATPVAQKAAPVAQKSVAQKAVVSPAAQKATQKGTDAAGCRTLLARLFPCRDERLAARADRAAARADRLAACAERVRNRRLACGNCGR